MVCIQRRASLTGLLLPALANGSGGINGEQGHNMGAYLLHGLISEM